MTLKYIGNGAAIIGVPARDLSDQEVKDLDWLITEEQLLKSGLYQKPGDFDEQDAAKVASHVRKMAKMQTGRDTGLDVSKTIKKESE